MLWHRNHSSSQRGYDAHFDDHIVLASKIPKFIILVMKASIGAIFGGLIGALVWGGIAYLTGYEVGYIAAGVGALVGFFSMVFGGSGVTNGMLCAAIALLAIIGGKFLAFGMMIDKILEPVIEPRYYQMKLESIRFSRMKTESEWKRFMIKNGYSNARSSNGVKTQEFKDFKETTVPLLQGLNRDLGYDEFRDKIKEEVITEMGGMMGLLNKSLDAKDALFFIIGIFAAFKIGSGINEESTEPPTFG